MRINKFFIFILLFIIAFATISFGKDVAEISLDSKIKIPMPDKTDDNSNENFIISTDKTVYNGLSMATVYVLINNTILNEKATIKFNFEGEEKINTFEQFKKDDWSNIKLIDNPNLVISKKSVYECKEQLKYDCINKNMSPCYETICNYNLVNDNYYIDNSRTLPYIKNIDKTFSKQDAPVTLQSGENYFKVNISFPMGTQSKFFIEAIGDSGGYGHLDPSINGTLGLDVALISYYNLNNNTASSTGNYNASAVSITATTSCKIGNCYYWNGEENRLVIPNDSPLDTMFGSTHYTVNFWLKTSDSSADIFSKSEKSFGNWIELQMSGSSLYYYIDDNIVNRYVGPISGTANGAWHMITIATNNSNFRVWVDSILRGTQSSPGNSINTKDVWFGDNDYSHGLVGYIDEIGLWNRTLTTVEINQLYNSASGCDPITSNYCVPTTTTTTTTSTTSTTSTTTTTLALCNTNQDCDIDCSLHPTITDDFFAENKTLRFINSGYAYIQSLLNYQNWYSVGCNVYFRGGKII